MCIMRVIVNNNVYEMDREQCDDVLDVASRLVPSGIYAVEKDDVVELKNDRVRSKNLLKREIVDYTNKGFKVYWNE